MSVQAVSVQAVYDVLGALTAAGLARRVAPAGGAPRYEAEVTYWGLLRLPELMSNT